MDFQRYFGICDDHPDVLQANHSSSRYLLISVITLLIALVAYKVYTASRQRMIEEVPIIFVDRETLENASIQVV